MPEVADCHRPTTTRSHRGRKIVSNRFAHLAAALQIQLKTDGRVTCATPLICQLQSCGTPIPVRCEGEIRVYGNNELREIGIDCWVGAWLEIHVAKNHAEKLTEQTIVRSVLCAVAQRETFEMLSLTNDGSSSAKGLVKTITGFLSAVHGKSVIGVDLNLAEEISKAMHGMTAGTWPDQLFALDEVE